MPMKALRYLAAIAGLLLFAACGGGSTDSSDSEKVVFRLNLTEGISSLDPALAKNQSNTWGINQLFDGLVRLNNNMEIEPALATSWEISPDGKDYTFQLRKGVKFHAHELLDEATREMKASDVVYSFNRIIDPKTASTGAWLLGGDLLDADSAFVAIDDYTFRIRLSKAFGPFLSRLSMQYLSVVPEKVATGLGANFRETPIGTGPFKLLKWREGEYLILEKNPDYWEMDEQGIQLPYVDLVNFDFQASKSTEFLKFRQGEYDFISDLDGAMLKDVLTAEGELQAEYAAEFQLIKAPYLNTEYLGILFETEHEEFSKSALRQRLVRQAINYGIDRDKLITTLRQGKGIPATAGFVPPSLYGKGDAFMAYDYQPEKAARLLAEAGFPGGKGMPEARLHTTAQYVDICSFVANQLGDLGIPVKVEQVEGGVHYELRVKGETEFFRASWIADYPDAESYLSCFFGGHSAPPNYTRFKLPAFDQLYSQTVAESDPLIQSQQYRALDSLLMTEAPIVPLFYDEILRFIQPGVSGMAPNGINMLDLRRVKK